MKVMFDHRVFIEQSYGGVSRYFAALAQHLPQLGITPRIFAPMHVNAYLERLPGSVVRGRKVPRRRVNMAIGRRLGTMLLPWAARVEKPDVIHETFFHPSRSGPKRIPVVLTVYDMIHELFPGMGGGEAMVAAKKAAIRRADRIACISENTRRDLIRFYPEVADRAVVTLLGFDPVTALAPTAPAEASERPYLLYVGDRSAPHKNFLGLVDALAGSELLKRDIDLVCVGGGDFSDLEEQALAAAGIGSRTRRVDADDRALHSLYCAAAAFVYPSLYEGFGIPPLEAMAADCPVITARSSSIPEVCGDAAQYSEPGDSESLRSAIEQVLSSPQRVAELRAAGRKRIEMFTWQRCAADTAAVYRSLA